MADGQLNIQARLDINDLVKTAARYRQEVTRMGVITDQQGNVMSTAWTRMKQAATAYLSIDLARKIAETRGQFQSLQVAFETMLNSQEKAQKLMSEAVELAAKTPFSLEDVATGAKQLLAYGFAAEDITETLRRLGDVASALGLPMERLTYLYGTTATQGRLYAKDMIQFTTSGIPVLQELAKMYGKTTEEINNMVTAGEVGFEDVRKVFEQMTNEGGQFYNLMEKTSTTISGKISNLADAIQVMFNNIGESNEGIINGAIDGAKWLVENYQSVINILKVLVATYGTYKAALIAVAAAQRIEKNNLIDYIRLLIMYRKQMGLATAAKQAFIKTKFVKHPYALLLSAITAIITALVSFNKKTQESSRSIGELESEIKEEGVQINSLVSKLSDSNTKEDERRRIIEEIRKIQPKIIEGLESESLSYETLKRNITDYNEELVKRMALASKQDKIQEAINKQIEAGQNRAAAEADIAKAILKLQSDFNDLDIMKLNPGGSIFDWQNITDKERKNLKRSIDEIIAGSGDWIDKAIKIQNLFPDTEKAGSGLTAFKNVGVESLDSLIEKWARYSSEVRISEKDVEEARKDVKNFQKTFEQLFKKAESNSLEESIKTFEEQLEQAKKNVSSLKDRLSDLRSGKVKSNDYNKDIEETLSQLKEAEKVVENLTGVTDAMRKQQERENQKRLETVKKINEELLSLEEQNQNSRIELMKEGAGKEIAQINLDYQRRIAEIKKLADKWAKEQGGKLTTEQNIQVSTAFTSAEDIKNKDTAEVYKKELDDLLKQYQDFDAKRRSIDDKYAKDKQTLESRRTTSNASEIDSAINELNYQKEEALNEIAMEFASRSEEFEIWMNEIATFSMEELQKRLREAKALLGSLQIAGAGGDKLAVAIAKVVALEKEIANQNKKTSTSPDKRSVKDWQELYKTLSKVDEQFKDIGDSIGGTAGELLSSAGSISTAILSMIDGIVTLTTGSIQSLEGVSKAAANAIRAVETASVILAIVGAALQVITKIYSMIKGRSKAERDAERLSKVTNKIAETNEIINNLIEKRIDLIKAATTAERNGLKLTTEEAIKAQQDLIQVQYSKLWKNEILGKKGKNNDLDVKDLGLSTVEQLKAFLENEKIWYNGAYTTLVELEKQGYGLTDKDKWYSIVEEWEKLNEQADQLKETTSEINTGINFDEARDGLDDFLLSADTTFKDISDNFEDYMRQSILNVVKSDYLNEEMQKWYEDFEKRTEDGKLSDTDVNYLRKKYEDIYNEAQDLIDDMLNAAGVNLEGAVPNSQAGAISETITEETASVMMGIWRGQYDVTKNIHTELISLRSDYKAAISKSNDILDMIASNTGRTADNTDGIGTTLKSIDNRLKTLETNSNKKYTK